MFTRHIYHASEGARYEVPILYAFECNSLAFDFTQKKNNPFDKFKNTKNNHNYSKINSQQSFRMSFYNSLRCTCIQLFQLVKNDSFLTSNSLQASVILSLLPPPLLRHFHMSSTFIKVNIHQNITFSQ